METLNISIIFWILAYLLCFNVNKSSQASPPHEYHRIADKEHPSVHSDARDANDGSDENKGHARVEFRLTMDNNNSTGDPAGGDGKFPLRMVLRDDHENPQTREGPLETVNPSPGKNSDSAHGAHRVGTRETRKLRKRSVASRSTHGGNTPPTTEKMFSIGGGSSSTKPINQRKDASHPDERTGEKNNTKEGKPSGRGNFRIIRLTREFPKLT